MILVIGLLNIAFIMLTCVVSVHRFFHDIPWKAVWCYPRAFYIYRDDHDHMVYVFESILIIFWAQTCCEPPPWAALFRPWLSLVMRLLQNSCSLENSAFNWASGGVCTSVFTFVPSHEALQIKISSVESRYIPPYPDPHLGTNVSALDDVGELSLLCQSVTWCFLPLPNQSLSLHCQHSAYPGLPVVRTGFVE